MAGFNKCTLTINGTKRDRLGNYELGSQIYAVSIKLMEGTDYVNKTPDYGFTFSEKGKKGVNLTNWETVLDGTATANVKLDGGQTRVHSNCKILEVKESAFDGETEVGQTMTVYSTGYKMV
jgi:hypothetical protein